MEGLRGILGGDIVDVNPIEITNENSVVNARKKAELDSLRAKESGVDPDGSGDYEIEDDIFS
jgi:hypothetical protein